MLWNANSAEDRTTVPANGIAENATTPTCGDGGSDAEATLHYLTKNADAATPVPTSTSTSTEGRFIVKHHAKGAAHQPSRSKGTTTTGTISL